MAVKSMGNLDLRGLFVGLSTVDFAYLVEALPGRNEKASARSQQISAGGPAANAAVAFSFLGGNSVLVTAVGHHPLGDVIRNDLNHCAVSLRDIASEHKEAPPVSSIFITRKSGERTVVSANANAFPTLEWRVDPKWFDGASTLLVDGHYMPLCVAAAKQARSRAIPVLLDGGSWKAGMHDLIANVDMAICSSDFRPPGCRNESDLFEFLSAKGITSAAITRGAEAIRYTHNGVNGELPIQRVRVVDTLGAGDILHGAFCYWACQPEHGFLDSLEFAARIATFSCLYFGTRAWMEVFPGTQAIMRELPDMHERTGGPAVAS